MKTIRKCFILLTLLLVVFPLGAQAFLDVEGGVAFAGYNDVRIPSDIGTAFSLSEETPSSLISVLRIRGGYTFLDRHTVSILIAPLTVQGSGKIGKDVTFQDKTFLEGSDVSSTYRFDSYRMTYRWTFLKRDSLNLGIGLTAKIRSADIALMSDSGYAHRDNLGVVPLINFRAEWFFDDNLGVLLDGDALASPYGRAEDVNLALLYQYSPETVFRVGYRILEGGSDGGGDVYTFALFHYLTAGIQFTF
ncbi:hypothetical protein EXM22_09175 [Oceanispirochaeta crateris]|uniref:Outer membrane protein beta-barrel domain-containing protein n=1 Tax=Oceanispirochaeta crateris TaxID=2518645 RepID=A0A5C1QMG0_9SPIO|nr:hypothetical protein [Oceanispirochaeta crateris]QEN08150.1 hypothetical protein EXM22_09175 [Oceanispirochaeta crateris]